MRSYQLRDPFLLAAFLLVMGLQISGNWLPTPDASGYISMANSLADTGQMKRLGNPHLYLNPCYPLLIAPLFIGDGFPFWQVSVAQWCFLSLFVVASYLWVKNDFPEWAVFIAILAGGNALIAVHYRRTLSELAFMAVMMWLVLCIQQATRKIATSRFILLLFGIAILAGLLPAIRHAGIVVVFGFCVGLFVTRFTNWFSTPAEKLSVVRLAVIFLVLMGSAAASEAAVIIHEKTHSEQVQSETYLDRFAENQLAPIMLIREGIRLRAQDIGRLLIPGMFKNGVSADDSWRHPMAVVYLVFALWLARGWWLFLKQSGDLLAIAFPFYLGLHIVWPFDQGGRFLVPMSALLMTCLFTLFHKMLRGKPVILNRLVLGFVTVHLLVMLGHWWRYDRPAASATQARWEELVPLVTQPELLSTVEQAGLTEIVAITPPVARKSGCLVQVLIDRRYVRLSNQKPIPEDVQWIVSNREEVAGDGFGDGFKLNCESGSFKLWQRTASKNAEPGSTAVVGPLALPDDTRQPVRR